ncbi:ATP-dependent DNA helicase PIF1-like [Sitodiplosis mosellana]|uniref:ATP-dependent DNA helicase PIF1-like n=1 Tax=Sitodiplosis mosellana TaxID=263140 RepID=UPI0024440F9A|nr:ATP-dependent DNA helicase PIF1-like [Sitodiplosis mosellana]
MVDAKLLSESQTTAFQKIIGCLTKSPPESGTTFMVQGAAGTGKTFLLNHIVAHCESKDIKAIALAYTGIASCLLKKGKTVHSQFRIPWNQKQIKCMLDSTHPLYKTIETAKVLLWDQAAFCSKQIFEEVDRFLRVIMNTKQTFGGKLMVISGDFNECLPICKKTKFESAESNSLLYSKLFKDMETFTLHENQRFKSQTDYRFCVEIGCGIHTEVAVPSACRVFSLDTLINTTYGHDYESISSNDLLDRSLLTVCAVDAEYLNNECIQRLYSANMVFHSLNFFRKINPNERSRFYSIEETMEDLPKYFPPKTLQLNKNCPIMLRQAYKGLPQGTRLVVKNIIGTSIIAEIGAGHRKVKTISIYRVNTIKIFQRANLQFVRRQFPISLAFSMTINKAQGLQFNRVGVYFPVTAFAHGQMYVAFSRTPAIEENMKVFVEEPNDGRFTFDRMPNVVNGTVAKYLLQSQS